MECVLETPPFRGGWEGLMITNNKAPKERN